MELIDQLSVDIDLLLQLVLSVVRDRFGRVMDFSIKVPCFRALIEDLLALRWHHIDLI